MTKNKQASVMGPAEGPQALPTEDILNIPAEIETEEQKLERLKREAEINKVPPQPENNVGPATTGVGQPDLQPVQQGNSLPPVATPVSKRFETAQFYDPLETERAILQKDRAERGGQKADF